MPEIKPAAGDALALLQQQTPEPIVKFAEAFLENDCDGAAACKSLGLEGARAKEMVSDRRFWLLLQAMRGELRETHKELRVRCLMMVAGIALFDPAAAFNRAGEPLLIHEMPAEVRACVESIERKPDGSWKIRLAGPKTRLTALELLFKLFGDLDSVVVSGTSARVIFHGRSK